MYGVDAASGFRLDGVEQVSIDVGLLDLDLAEEVGGDQGRIVTELDQIRALATSIEPTSWSRNIAAAELSV